MFEKPLMIELSNNEQTLRLQYKFLFFPTLLLRYAAIINLPDSAASLSMMSYL